MTRPNGQLLCEAVASCERELGDWCPGCRGPKGRGVCRMGFINPKCLRGKTYTQIYIYMYTIYINISYNIYIIYNIWAEILVRAYEWDRGGTLTLVIKTAALLFLASDHGTLPLDSLNKSSHSLTQRSSQWSWFIVDYQAYHCGLPEIEHLPLSGRVYIFEAEKRFLSFFYSWH